MAITNVIHLHYSNIFLPNVMKGIDAIWSNMLGG